jgi:phage tail protein X
MNFTKVDLLSSDSSEVITMSFEDPTLEYSYVLKALLGLDVDEITTRYYGRSASGSPFYTMNVGPRTVVIQVKMNPNYAIGETVRSLRARVYRAISSTRTGALTLRFKDQNDDSVASISGFVKKVEAEHFSAKPELKITLDCSRDPLLRGEVDIDVPVTFDNPFQAVITDDVSEAPHGLKMSLRCLNPGLTLSFSDILPNEWAFNISPTGINGGSGFFTNDEVFISSEDHNRYIYVVRNGVTYHLAQSVEPGSVWPIMFPGNTTFTRSTNFEWLSISYRTAFWGI